jgi:hypothetical protein
MRGVSKQNVIKRARLKFIKIATFQNKVFASKRPEMREKTYDQNEAQRESSIESSARRFN